MLTHPGFDPVALQIGPLAIHWYGLMYLLGFAGCWWLGVVQGRRPHWQWSAERVSDLLFYVALGVILGGRLGYIFFYDFAAFIDDPLRLLRIWEGGMSFHGGLLGVLVAMWLFARRIGSTLTAVGDFVVTLVPFGLFTGRIGNFINGELWGKPSDLPWAMVFPQVDQLPRHPSMLYEALLEGLVLLAILWWFSAKPRPRGMTSGLFLILYAVFRSLVEFVRTPDAHIGYLAGTSWFTMGMLLCVPMLLAGCGLVLWSLRGPRSGAGAA